MPTETTERRMNAQFASECLSCGHAIAKGEQIIFDSETHFARHTNCPRRGSLRCLSCLQLIEGRNYVRTSDDAYDQRLRNLGVEILAGYMHYNCRQAALAARVNHEDEN